MQRQRDVPASSSSCASPSSSSSSSVSSFCFVSLPLGYCLHLQTTKLYVNWNSISLLGTVNKGARIVGWRSGYDSLSRKEMTHGHTSRSINCIRGRSKDAVDFTTASFVGFIGHRMTGWLRKSFVSLSPLLLSSPLSLAPLQLISFFVIFTLFLSFYSHPGILLVQLSPSLSLFAPWLATASAQMTLFSFCLVYSLLFAGQ